MTEPPASDHYSAPPSPGEVLKQKLLHERQLTQRQLARALGVSEPRLAMMLKGRRAVSAEIALRIERAFGFSPHYWMRICAEYELYQVRQRFRAALDALAPVQDRSDLTASGPRKDDFQAAA